MDSAPSVLVTDGDDGQSRTPLATVRALAAGGFRPFVTVSGRYSLAAASRDASGSVRVPSADRDAAAYAAAVRDEVAARGHLAVFPTSDPALLALGTPVAHLVDKGSLMDAARAVGLPPAPAETVQTREELLARALEFEYPAVVKPTVGHGSKRVDGPGDLGAVDADGPFLVQPYLDGYLLSVAGVVWQGRLVAAVHQRFLRTWPPDCGMACAAETIEPDLDVEERLLALLDGFEGVFQADVAQGYLLDVNPRVYASLPLAVAAGANLPAIYCWLLMGEDVGFVRGRSGVFFRWLDGDVRSVLRSLRSRDVRPLQAMAALRPRRGTAHGLESLRDPRPMLTRARFALRRNGHRSG